MTERQWLKCKTAMTMLAFLRGKPSERKWRLFGCGCCRLVWPLLVDERSRDAVVVAEAYADKHASKEQLKKAYQRAWDVTREAYREGDVAEGWTRESADAAWAAFAMTEKNYGESMYAIAQEVLRAVTPQQAADMLRDIFGNPIRPATLDPTWITPTVLALAKACYAEGCFERLPVLGDSLEEAGCTEAAILAHCRAATPHVRGCWVVDLLLKKT